MTTPDGPDKFAPTIGQQSFINEETSSGDESALLNLPPEQRYAAKRALNRGLRSSFSAAEEETSFAGIFLFLHSFKFFFVMIRE